MTIEPNFAALAFGKGWRVVEEREDGKAFRRWDNLQVIASFAKEEDGKVWLHVSASYPTRVPTWKELVQIKNLLLGENQYAVMVMPPKPLYVNINPNVLHFFSCLEGHPLPEFSRRAGTI